jgi:hypothetical protein
MVLAPGVYELRVAVKSKDGKQTAERTALFRVEP